MVEIIAHRGYWDNHTKKNSIDAFVKSFENGFGVETDLRDLNGDIVISHDIPNPEMEIITFDNFLKLYCEFDTKETLALNIKSDGLACLIKQKLNEYRVSNYFVFDMSIPDMLSYKNISLNFFTRHSEIEKKPCLYEESLGVWLDQFYSSWFSENDIKKHHANNKKICIVSPELHNRPYTKEWLKYKHILEKNSHLQLIICTDFPEEARNFFE